VFEPSQKQVALKNLCLIPGDWTLDDLLRHPCHDGSHSHRSFAQAHDAEKRGQVQWLRQPTRRLNGVIKLLFMRPEGRPATPGSSLNHGLSYRVGAELALAVYAGEDWARLMLREINMRPAQGVSA
jgi:hypothetical protein